MRKTRPCYPIIGLQSLIALALSVCLVCCGDEQVPRSAGSPCEADDGCDTSLCYTNICLEPAADDDLDGLINEVESQLGTDPSLADTDGDGIADAVEVGNLSDPHDEDQDGLIDAVESTIVDADNDCLSAQKDADEAALEDDVFALADKGCCCYGSCSESGISVEPAKCELNDAGAPVISCPPDLEPDTDGDGIPNNCDPCPNDATDTCDFAPHGLTFTPEGPSNESTPVFRGVAPHASRIAVTMESCDRPALVETHGTGGAFEVAVPVPANTTTTFHVTAYDITDTALGCSDPITYTHDDIAPDAPTLNEAVSIGDGENMTITGSAQPDTWVSLFAGTSCEAEAEIYSDLDVNFDDWTADVTPVLPEFVTATAADTAGNVSDCSTSLELTPHAACSVEEMNQLTGSTLAGPTILEALIACTLLDASEGGCGGEPPVNACRRCVVEKLYPDAITARAACSRCMARIVPYMATCPEVCTVEGTADDEGDSCLACACSREGAEKAVTECGAGALCALTTSQPPVELVDGPYAGQTCLDVDAGCETYPQTSTSDGCIAITGAISAAATDEGVLWSSDTCQKGDDSFVSARLVRWAGQDTLPEDLPTPNLIGAASVATNGQSVAVLGVGNNGAVITPTLLSKGPDDELFSLSWFLSLEGTTLYDRPVIVSDRNDWLYTVARVPEAPANRLTVLVKPGDDSDWAFAAGVGLPKDDSSQVPSDLLGPGTWGAVPGLDLAAAPPNHLHALLWRANLTSETVIPMAYHYRLDLTDATVTAPSNLSPDDRVMEAIPFFPDFAFSLMSETVVSRIDVVAEPQPDGSLHWVPHVAHWAGYDAPFNSERLLLLRRAGAPGGEPEWESVAPYEESNTLTTQDTCAPAPTDAEHVCTFDVTTERLLDLVGGNRVRMLVATATKECHKNANCSDETGICEWLPAQCSEELHYGYMIRYQDPTGTWTSTTATRDLTPAPIEEGALVIDRFGTIHVAVGMLDEEGAVSVRYQAMRCPGGSCDAP